MIPRGWEGDRAKAKENPHSTVGSCNRQVDLFSAGLGIQVMEEQEQGDVKQRRGGAWGSKELVSAMMRTSSPVSHLSGASMWAGRVVC